jgi:hypothetical protein
LSLPTTLPSDALAASRHRRGPPTTASVKDVVYEALTRDGKGRKTKTVQVGFRLPADLVKRIDAYVARIANENPGLEVTRASQ